MMVKMLAFCMRQMLNSTSETGPKLNRGTRPGVSRQGLVVLKPAGAGAAKQLAGVNGVLATEGEAKKASRVGEDGKLWSVARPLAVGSVLRTGKTLVRLATARSRSEERRVGKECRSRWS